MEERETVGIEKEGEREIDFAENSDCSQQMQKWYKYNSKPLLTK